MEDIFFSAVQVCLVQYKFLKNISCKKVALVSFKTDNLQEIRLDWPLSNWLFDEYEMDVL